MLGFLMSVCLNFRLPNVKSNESKSEK